MNRASNFGKTLFSMMLLAGTLLSGCTVVKVVDLTASAALGVGAGAVKTTGAVVGAAIPDGDDKEDE